ncbi:MAG: peptide deformylase [Leptospiraceae bacterium]|nr:peptide deformylase [Leptospiraceae bacterium]MCP5495178.1 peptide deformylase [Leptospiraceae bacterium]
MSVLKVLKIGNPLLRKKSLDISETEVATKEFKKLVRDMFDTMRYEGGVGLAAPQIGILKRVVVVGAENNEKYENSGEIPEHVLINPIITPLESSLRGFWEGCLSVPEMRGYVERPSKIKMEWYDHKWNFHSEVIEGFRAVVYQHECDHLDGIIYVDRLKDTKLFGYLDSLELKEDDTLD